jgi:hypothetical protein
VQNLDDLKCGDLIYFEKNLVKVHSFSTCRPEKTSLSIGLIVEIDNPPGFCKIFHNGTLHTVQSYSVYSGD